MPRDWMSIRRRKPPAYPRVGTGEDFPSKRPGTKVGEDRYGNKRLQPTRATQARTQRRYLKGRS
jgi:hypothetical protein